MSDTYETRAEQQKQSKETIQQGYELVRKAEALLQHAKETADKVGMNDEKLKRYLESDQVPQKVHDSVRREQEAFENQLREDKRQALAEARAQQHPNRRTKKKVMPGRMV